MASAVGASVAAVVWAAGFCPLLTMTPMTTTSEANTLVMKNFFSVGDMRVKPDCAANRRAGCKAYPKWVSPRVLASEAFLGAY